MISRPRGANGKLWLPVQVAKACADHLWPRRLTLLRPAPCARAPAWERRMKDSAVGVTHCTPFLPTTMHCDGRTRPRAARRRGDQTVRSDSSTWISTCHRLSKNTSAPPHLIPRVHPHHNAHPGAEASRCRRRVGVGVGAPSHRGLGSTRVSAPAARRFQRGLKGGPRGELCPPHHPCDAWRVPADLLAVPEHAGVQLLAQGYRPAHPPQSTAVPRCGGWAQGRLARVWRSASSEETASSIS